MSVDNNTHPSELCKSGDVAPGVGVRELREAIPAHCFKHSIFKSLAYLAHDLTWAGSLAYLSYRYFPSIESTPLRWAAWTFYSWLQGLVFTGLWVIGHESGHGAFLPSQKACDAVGFVLHSFLLTPYFSWKSSHRRHHTYANHMVLDHNYVPPRRDEYLQALGPEVRGLDDLVEDAPFVTFVRILLQHIFGFPMYLMNNSTASARSLHEKPSEAWLGNSHFAPWGSLFRRAEAPYILASDIGLGLTITSLYFVAQRYGLSLMLSLYVGPYLWLNGWIVAITYLHHTHPNLPKFEPEAWTFIKGATATVDRHMGFLGRYFLHNILDFHVIHHLFPRIPFYHTPEATRAIQPLLGELYHADKNRGFLEGLWESSRKCQWVEADPTKDQKKDAGTLWYQAGPSPPPEIAMGRRIWFPFLK